MFQQLVGQKIPGKGVAISGQNHKHFEKGVKEIPPVFRKAIGLNGEITMLQLYKVALTPGKAYNDHTYHHSHYTTPPPEPPQLPEEGKIKIILLNFKNYLPKT